MKNLNESQFHTVWTEAVGMDGYNKKMFQEVLKSLQDKGLIVKEKWDEKEVCTYTKDGICHLITDNNLICNGKCSENSGICRFYIGLRSL